MFEVVEFIADIVVIIMGLFAAILLALLSFIAWKAYRLFSYVKDEVPDFMATAKDTAATARQTATSVQGTASFVEDTVVSPLIKAVAFVAAVTRFFTVLFGSNRRR